MRILRIGSTGPAVQLLQLALNRAGFGPLETDGIFGPLTEAALRRFQSARGILSDGVAGRETHRALLPWYTGSLLHRIEKGDTIAKLAQRYGTTTEAIFLANPEAEAENLRIGESLVIPLPFPVVPTTIGYSARLTELCLPRSARKLMKSLRLFPQSLRQKNMLTVLKPIQNLMPSLRLLKKLMR